MLPSPKDAFHLRHGSLTTDRASVLFVIGGSLDYSAWHDQPKLRGSALKEAILDSPVSEFVQSSLLELLQAESVDDDEMPQLMIRALDLAAERFFNSIKKRAQVQTNELRAEAEGFVEGHERRWGPGLDWLRLHRQCCLEAGQEFQAEFLKHDDYVHDQLLGVLMRLHANACRIQGEIITLLAAGYPDGAYARWRTLHEIAVTAIILHDAGENAARDYIRFGLVQAVKGMNGYQATATRMRREPYSQQELDEANALMKRICEESDFDFSSRNGWARKYLKSSKFQNLQKAAGLEHWINDYSSASRDVHTDFRRMQSLIGMHTVEEDALLCGPSSYGLAEPAHSAAISLMQATIAFILAHQDRPKSSLDFSASLVFAKVIGMLTDEVGEVFGEIHKEQSAVGRPVVKKAKRTEDS